MAKKKLQGRNFSYTFLPVFKPYRIEIINEIECIVGSPDNPPEFMMPFDESPYLYADTEKRMYKTLTECKRLDLLNIDAILNFCNKYGLPGFQNIEWKWREESFGLFIDDDEDLDRFFESGSDHHCYQAPITWKECYVLDRESEFSNEVCDRIVKDKAICNYIHYGKKWLFDINNNHEFIEGRKIKKITGNSTFVESLNGFKSGMETVKKTISGINKSPININKDEIANLINSLLAGVNLSIENVPFGNDKKKYLTVYEYNNFSQVLGALLYDISIRENGIKSCVYCKELFPWKENKIHCSLKCANTMEKQRNRANKKRKEIKTHEAV